MRAAVRSADFSGVDQIGWCGTDRVSSLGELAGPRSLRAYADSEVALTLPIAPATEAMKAPISIEKNK